MTKKETNNKKRMQGVVTKIGSANTITVKVETKTTHPLYKKIVKTHKKYLVHNTDTSIAVNDKVIIEGGKPVSKNKSFYFVKKTA
jgi:small subunit ribosomal protein S17